MHKTGLALSAQLIYKKQIAEVAELADALGSGPSGLRAVEVQVLSSAPCYERTYVDWRESFFFS